MTEVRVVGSGVDSLYLSARGELWDGLLELMSALRQGAEEAGEPRVCWFREEDGAFLVPPHGWRRYPHLLSSPRIELCLGAPAPFPPAYVMLRSSFIHTVGAEVAVATVSELLQRYVFPKQFTIGVARIDIYADEQGWEPSMADFPLFSCRAVRRRLFEVPRQLHASGRQVSGFTFGKGDVVARIYNKSLEMRVTEETWSELLWQGAERDRPVWRTEFQFRSRALRSLGLAGVPEVLNRRQDLWEYGTRWLSLRRPTKHVKRSRWPEAPEWAQLRAAPLGSPSNALVRERLRTADELRLVRGFVGYTSSLAALHDVKSLGGALRQLTPAARQYLMRRGVHFEDLVERKQRTRLKLAHPASPTAPRA